MSFRSWTKPFSWVFPVKDYAANDYAVAFFTVVFFTVVFFTVVQSKNETARQNGPIFLWVK